jgi:hypothetical protein
VVTHCSIEDDTRFPLRAVARHCPQPLARLQNEWWYDTVPARFLPKIPVSQLTSRSSPCLRVARPWEVIAGRCAEAQPGTHGPLGPPPARVLRALHVTLRTKERRSRWRGRRLMMVRSGPGSAGYNSTSGCMIHSSYVSKVGLLVSMAPGAGGVVFVGAGPDFCCPYVEDSVGCS